MQLVSPCVELHSSFLDSLREWEGEQQPGTGMRMDRFDLEAPEGFAGWVASLRKEETDPDPGLVACTYFWMVEEGEYAGTIALRHELNDFLYDFGGHVGYSVRPSMRGRGFARQALREVLEVAWDMGIDRVLITCSEDNEASRRVIEACGGKQEDIRGGKRRFWIDGRR